MAKQNLPLQKQNVKVTNILADAKSRAITAEAQSDEITKSIKNPHQRYLGKQN